MSNKIIPIAKGYIERGIKKYNATIDDELQTIISNSGFDYTPYLFSDGRVFSAA